ncbi:MAG: hypothetical protein ACK5EA_10575 [Planctomycetaceae bacterium]
MWVFPLRKAFLLLVVGLTALAGPALAPPTLSLGTIIRLTPSVVRLLVRLRQLDLPERFRQANWLGPRRQGSCVHASIVHLLHGQGRHDLATWWREQHADGETPDSVARQLEAAGLRYAETRTGEVRFLEWALRTRRGAAVVVQEGRHMVTLVGLDARSAHILDSNAPQEIQHWPRRQFLAEWQSSGGWALTILGVPSAPQPWLVHPLASNSGVLACDKSP